jgi:DNA mismatch repair protein MSH2
LKTSVAQSTLREALTTKQLKIEIWVQEVGAGKKSAQFKLDKEVSCSSTYLVHFFIEQYTLNLWLCRRHLETCKLLKTLFSSNDLASAPIVMSVKLANAAAGQASSKVNALGVAFADTSRRELGVADFLDSELYSNLEVGFVSDMLCCFEVLTRSLLVPGDSAFGERGNRTQWDE